MGQNLIENKLIEKNGHYSIDFTDFEEKVRNGTEIEYTILNRDRRNPGGRVWSKEELLN